MTALTVLRGVCLDQEYTSSAGGKIFFPEARSDFRKRLRERNSGVTSSSFRWASQDSWRVAISRVKSSFCSGVSLATQAFLSKVLTMGAVLVVDLVVEVGSGGEESGGLVVPFVAVVDRGLDGGKEEVVVLGGPKKDVREAWALGFLGSDGDEEGRSAAFRLRVEAMMGVGRRRRRSLRECSLMELN